MHKRRYCYLIKVQFLGFRLSGWQKQPGQKTVEGLLLKTLKYILPDVKYKILGAGRTDAKVSALDAAFELFVYDYEINEEQEFLTLFNKNLPPDIRVISISEIKKKFNIIHGSKSKQYVYLFSFGEKNHPFSAPFIGNFIEYLDLDNMKKAAELYVGTHDFSSYTARLQEKTKVIRTITSCKIVDNTILKANFFPNKSYAFIVEGQGFMRYQVRMMMGALVLLGRGELSLMDFKKSLEPNSEVIISFVAPGSGLLLNKLDFDSSEYL